MKGDEPMPTEKFIITTKCTSCRKCGEFCSAKWGWKYVLIKTHSLRHKEMLNGLNEVKGFEQSSKV